ncbi:WAP four-disulfide core domain protein 13 [Erinaceus europaeus]|uniref:WAP four-disulfide core domain protein 13 n=1 Tax=Erinaceus europaeus TaxID=9365 RepID=A0A1S3APN9_ERIEU|nr:WAP four-disulfide core domain protein 13 [Erinaceus europaeus]
MKSVLLQLLVLICPAPHLVPANPAQHFLRHILEPPPCRSAPEDCSQFCTLQKDCPKGLQCCSSFCGIICSLNQN